MSSVADTPSCGSAAPHAASCAGHTRQNISVWYGFFSNYRKITMGETVARSPGFFHPARASCKAWSVWARPSPCASRHISSAMRALICS